MSAAVIIQARTGSQRLPGKILEPLAGRPLLHHVIERARGIRAASTLVVTVPENDFLAGECAREVGAAVSYGPHPDLLGAYLKAWREVGEPLWVVRLTADCPFLDPDVCAGVLEMLMNSKGAALYCHNTRPGVDGLDTEAFFGKLLIAGNAVVKDEMDRHHCTPWMRRMDTGVLHYAFATELAASLNEKCKLSVDTAEDLRRAQRIAERLVPREYSFTETLRAMKAAGVL